MMMSGDSSRKCGVFFCTNFPIVVESARLKKSEHTTRGESRFQIAFLIRDAHDAPYIRMAS